MTKTNKVTKSIIFILLVFIFLSLSGCIEMDNYKKVTLSYYNSDKISQEVWVGDEINKPTDPIKIGFKFEEWYEDESLTRPINWPITIIEDTIIYAKWSPLVYKITWKDEKNQIISTEEYAYNDIPYFDLPENTSEYEYSWLPAIVPVTGDASYTLTSTKRLYTVTWKNFDGSVLEVNNVEHGSIPVYKGTKPTRMETDQFSYVFDGWHTTIGPVSGHTEYIARYIENNRIYQVTWKNTDGTIIEVLNYKYGDLPNRALPTNTSKYTYYGWSPDITMIKGNATYTALRTEKLNSPTNIEKIDEYIVGWDSIEHAKHYEVTIDSIYTILVDEPKVDLFDYIEDSTSHYLTIVAIGDGVNFFDSEISNYIFKTVTKNQRYVPNQVNQENGLLLDYTFSYESETENSEYYVFYLGTIEETPIFTSYAYRYDMDTEVTIGYQTVSLEGIINTTSVSTTTIKTVTKTTDTSGIKNLLGKIPAVGNILSSIVPNWSFSNTVGSEVTRSNSNAEFYANALSISYNTKFTFSQQNGFIKGRSYRMSLMNVVDMFAIVRYHVLSDTYSYEFKPFIKDNSNNTFIVEVSDEYGSFSNSTSKSPMIFNIEEAINIINDKETKINDKYYSETLKAAHAIGFDGGDGSINNPYQIKGVVKPAYEQLLLLNNPTLSDKNIILKTDIDLSKYNYTDSINKKSFIYVPFTGYLNGNNHTISNLTYTLTTENTRPDNDKTYVYGLFGHMNGTVANLKIQKFSTSFNKNSNQKFTDTYYIGLLAGRSEGRIINVQVSNSQINTNFVMVHSGAIVGSLESGGSIESIRVTNYIFDGEGNAGGIAGISNESSSIMNSIVSNSIFDYY